MSTRPQFMVIFPSHTLCSETTFLCILFVNQINKLVSTNFAVLLAILQRIRQIVGSNLRLDIAYGDWFLVVVRSPYSQIMGYHVKICHTLFKETFVCVILHGPILIKIFCLIVITSRHKHFGYESNVHVNWTSILHRPTNYSNYAFAGSNPALCMYVYFICTGHTVDRSPIQGVRPRV